MNATTRHPCFPSAAAGTARSKTVARAAISCCAVMMVLLGMIGCASPSGPTYLTVAPEQYDEAFDAAVNVARGHGLTPGLRDRRGGVIETEPARAGSVLEPWDRLNASPGRAMENTVSHQRRIARFEFLPVAFAPDRARPGESLTGPDILAERHEPTDLTTHDGELELRVWVYVERFHRPGVRRSTWSRRMTTTARVIDPEDERPMRSSWTPVRRDPDVERRLLARVQRELAQQTDRE